MDDYSNFVFYGSWKTLLDGFTKEQAKEILWQIVNYGVGNSFDTDDKMIVAIVQGAIAPTINAAHDRYLQSVINGKKGGRPKKEIDMKEVNEMLNKGISKKSIAATFNISTDTLDRRLKEMEQNYFAEEIPQNRTAKTANAQNPYKDIDNDNDKDLDKDIDTCDFARFARNERKGNEKKLHGMDIAEIARELGF